MSVQVIYKNKAKSSDLGVIALFGNEKFQVQNLRSSFSKIETSYIEKISKNKNNTKENIISFIHIKLFFNSSQFMQATLS